MAYWITVGLQALLVFSIILGISLYLYWRVSSSVEEGESFDPNLLDCWVVALGSIFLTIAYCMLIVNAPVVLVVVAVFSFFWASEAYNRGR